MASSNPLLDGALELARFGWQIFPIVPRGKNPLIKGWQEKATTNPDVLRVWWDQHPDANVGLECGRSRVVVLDIETEDAKNQIEKTYGPLPFTPTSRTGRGGYHIFFSAPEQELKNKTKIQGIEADIRATGGLVVLAPSAHETGTHYTWAPGLEPWEVDLAPTPEWLIRIAGTRSAVVEAINIKTPATEQDIKNAYQDADSIPAATAGARNQTCFVRAATLLNDWALDNADAYSIFLRTCAKDIPPLDRAELEVIFQSAKTSASGVKGYKRQPYIQLIDEIKTRAPGTDDAGARAQFIAWLVEYLPNRIPNNLAYKEIDRVVKKVLGASMGLRQLGVHPKLDPNMPTLSADGWETGSASAAYAILTDENNWNKLGIRRYFYDERISGVFTDILDVGIVPLENAEIFGIRSKMEENFRDINGKKMEQTQENIRNAMTLIATQKYSFHPIEQWLQQLPKWDGKTRWLADNFGLEQEHPLRDTYLQKWSTAAVARMLRPGCKVDDVLVFVGVQGVGLKTTTLSSLVPDQSWFKEVAFSKDLFHREMLQKCHQSWIVEWGEIEQHYRADSGMLKQFLSTEADTYHELYKHQQIERPRRFIFCGTTNDESVLTDPTGSRRFWVIRKNIPTDLPWLKSNLAQLWAEAKHRFETGGQWYLTPEERAQQMEANEQFSASSTDPWTEAVLIWAAGKQDFEVKDILVDAIGVSLERITVGHNKRVGAILRTAKYTSRRQRASSGERATVWFRTKTG